MSEKKMDQQRENSDSPMEPTGKPHVSIDVPEGRLDDRSLDDASGGFVGGGTPTTRPTHY
jgi:hypothetical protein